MNVSAWSVRNPVAPILAFFVLAVLGGQSFEGLAITRFPTIGVPVVSIAVTQSGATPSELEIQVAKPIEDEVAGIPGIDHIQSTITGGRSMTVVTVHLECPPVRLCRMSRMRWSGSAAIFRPRSTLRPSRRSMSMGRRFRSSQSPLPA